MIKNDVKVKKQLTIVEIIKMTKELVEGYFIGGEYTPYYKEINDIVAFFKYCVDGLKFDIVEDGNGKKTLESVYNSVANDSELMSMFNNLDEVYDSSLLSQIESIHTDVADIVDFRKQFIIHSSTSIDKKVEEILNKESRNKDLEMKVLQDTERLQKEQLKQIEYANKIANMMTPEETVELNRLMIKNGEYDPNEVAKLVTDRYFQSGQHTKNLESVIESKNEKIRDLEKYKKMHEAVNVLSDDGK